MEKRDLYDRHRRRTGIQIVRGAPVPENMFTLGVEAVLYNSKGELLVQLRSPNKPVAPGLWAFTGGGVLAGESRLEGCVREVGEELGLFVSPDEAQLLISYMSQNSICDVYLIKTDVGINELKIQESEVSQAAWLGKVEFHALINDKSRFSSYPFIELLVRIIDTDARIWGAANSYK